MASQRLSPVFSFSQLFTLPFVILQTVILLTVLVLLLPTTSCDVQAQSPQKLPIKSEITTAAPTAKKTSTKITTAAPTAKTISKLSTPTPKKGPTTRAPVTFKSNIAKGRSLNDGTGSGKGTTPKPGPKKVNTTKGTTPESEEFLTSTMKPRVDFGKLVDEAVRNSHSNTTLEGTTTQKPIIKEAEVDKPKHSSDSEKKRKPKDVDADKPKHSTDSEQERADKIMKQFEKGNVHSIYEMPKFEQKPPPIPDAQKKKKKSSDSDK